MLAPTLLRRAPCFFLCALLSLVAALPSRPPRVHDVVSRSRGAPDVDTFTFLDNGVIRLGIDTSRGGTLGWLGPSSNSSFSILNIHDFGRVVQGSFYSGPSPFNPDGKCSEPGGWGRPWPWNPIGAGDVYVHAAPIVNVTVSPDSTSATVWTVPLQWACDDVPCDCLFEQRITLIGNAVEVALTMHTARADTTFYPAMTQELPAVYVIGDFCHLWTYNGTRPFSSDAAVEQPAVWGVNAWDSFTSGERWMAFTNASGWGVGVVSPGVAHFGAGFFNNGVIGTYNCTPRGYGPYSSETGYIAPWSAEIIDATSPFAYNFSLVLGSLGDIRAYAAAAHAAGRDDSLTPNYDFVTRGDRAHCTYNDAADAGLPVGGSGLRLNITGEFPQIASPITVFSPAQALRVAVNVSYDASLNGVSAALAWVALGDGSVCAGCVVEATVVADGTFRPLIFDLSSVPAYTSLPAVSRVFFLPLGQAPVSNGTYGLSLVNVSSILTL
jgi:hypothetical protein